MPLPLLPPAYTLVALDRDRAALPHALAAVARAPADGTVYWTDRADRLEVAFVLEPEAGAEATALAHWVLMTALADALGALLPPGKPVGLHWPDRISLDGATLGHATWRMGACASDAIPPWLVLGASLRIAAPAGGLEPGAAPDQTSLGEEGAGDVDSVRLLESLSRHFLAWTHRWLEDGFAPVARAWNARCPERGRELAVAHGGLTHRGRLLGLDVEGRLRIGSARLGLVGALAAA
jgi:biotin-(acetyl-CoA carboxylase) ligase